MRILWVAYAEPFQAQKNTWACRGELVRPSSQVGVKVTCYGFVIFQKARNAMDSAKTKRMEMNRSP